MDNEQRHWGVIGGGMLGLTLALELTDRGDKVTIHERGDTIGGLASSFQLGDVTWDRFYHVTLQSDAALRSLLQTLDLDESLQWQPTGTGLYANGKLYPVSSAIDYLKLPVLSPVAKSRIGATVLKASRTTDWRKMEQITARDWLTRWSGSKAYESFWAPLLRSKLGDRYEEASAAFIWAIIQRLYAARRAGMKQDLFGYVPGGYAQVLERFHDTLESRGVEIVLSSDVLEVADVGHGVQVRTAAGAEEYSDVIVTAPSPIAVDIVEGLTEAERTAHNGIQYQGVVCVSLLLDRPLEGYYVTNITEDSFPFTGVIEMTALVDPEVFGGRSLVYLPKYAGPTDPIFDQSDDDITNHFVDALSKMYPAVFDSKIEAVGVSRARHVLPISTVGYSESLPPMTTSVPGVHIVNTAHILNGTLNVDETVQLATRAAETLVGAPQRARRS
ncbi:MAG: NAD(P)/FAD-dependent oxidoreductase [Acidimicrobiia bacterium]